MKKKYIIPEVEFELMDLADGIMLEISSTEADPDLGSLVNEENLNLWDTSDNLAL